MNKDAGTQAAREIYERLKPIQEAKGYYFNPDMSVTLDVLEKLLEVKKRQGYMTCPCRLSSGDREKDRDIFCPCDYREADVREYGCCYCGLYVSREKYQEGGEAGSIPERRPVEKMF